MMLGRLLLLYIIIYADVKILEWHCCKKCCRGTVQKYRWASTFITGGDIKTRHTVSVSVVTDVNWHELWHVLFSCTEKWGLWKCWIIPI